MERPNTALLCCEIICLEDHMELEAGKKFSSWLPLMKGVLQRSVPVGPLWVCINAYADDEQIYASDKDPVKLEMKLQRQLLEADQWFGMDGMITNPDKYQDKRFTGTSAAHTWRKLF